jgi:dolichyl-phosphate beta-glucosyltransferase
MQILFLDADGATDFNEIEKFYKETIQVCKQDKKELSCVIACRNQATGGEVKRTAIRKLLNFINTSLVQFVLGFDVKDTQCGFKLFSREAAKRVFPT